MLVVIVMTLIETRKHFELSQAVAAHLAGVPLRTYIRYEADDEYGNFLKRKAIIDSIVDKCEITEDKGVLTVNQIINGVRDIIKENYQDSVSLCYLFGSYAKGYATEKSDVDLCVATDLTGFDFAGLAEEIHQKLHKNIDLNKLNNAGTDLIIEIMKDGIKIYG